MKTRLKSLTNKWIVETGYVRAVLYSRDVTYEHLIGHDAAKVLPGGYTLSALNPLHSYSSLTKLRISNGPDARIITRNLGPTDFDIVGDWDNSLVEIPFIIFSVLELPRQLSGMCSLHASAAYHQAGATLLLGDKGSGKTSTLIALLNEGYTFGGDDLVVLALSDSLGALPGRRLIAERARTPESNFVYEDKAIRTIDVGQTSLPVPISVVFRVSIHSSIRQTAIRRIIHPPISETLRLHENLARYIRGMPTPLAIRDGISHGYFPNLDTPCLASFRSRLMIKLFSIPYYYISAASGASAAIAIRDIK